MARLRLPQSIDDAKDLGILLSKYKETNYFAVVGAVVVTYILYPFKKLIKKSLCLIGTLTCGISWAQY